jgi:hypothetical protein
MYFVGFVVVLRVVLEDLCLLRIIPVTNEVIEIYFLPPVLRIDKPVISISFRLV